MQGGDADCNAAVAGAVLGCRVGYSRLPSDWLAGLLAPNSEWLSKKINAFLDLMAVWKEMCWEGNVYFLYLLK